MERLASYSELKDSALTQLRGSWGKAVLITLIMAVISAALGEIPGIGRVLGMVFAGPLTLGISYFYIRLWQGEAVRIGDMFEGLSRFGQALVLYLLNLAFVFLWSLLLIVPGIIACLSYSMAYYIMVDEPELSAMEALDKSKEMMRGHKWRYFVLNLSFIGWGVLCVLTLGIGLLWLIPYAGATSVNFYKNLKASAA